MAIVPSFHSTLATPTPQTIPIVHSALKNQNLTTKYSITITHVNMDGKRPLLRGVLLVILYAVVTQICPCSHEPFCGSCL